MNRTYQRNRELCRIASFFVTCALLMGIVGCRSVQDVKEQTRLDLHIEAADNVNPDEKGRAAPIQVRIYELKNENAFTSADFYSLQDNDKAVLGNDLLVSDEFILRPGEIRIIRRKTNPETTVIGVLAGYRGLARSQWRETYRLAEAPYASWYREWWPLKKAKLDINIGQRAIVVTELD
ncbi:MAG: type VI secretion system lipoprotein TssJ [Snodgrassella sp.]|uniref:type VI secretion system lipoprotein TssJ n=1 Tax=Snodgrassella TaxID=1193515 RepID=UPI001EF6A588|nr:MULTISPECIES: type VI secretion system lipoprotein TssJ [Snodgrassella]MCO6514394.1 type VI secretion system lipoprotein TssJ [Snodgrassella sp.]MCO6520987.1 type VI secretion system lipoprotein TssJ [Snodgrassella sp.]